MAQLNLICSMIPISYVCDIFISSDTDLAPNLLRKQRPIYLNLSRSHLLGFKFYFISPRSLVTSLNNALFISTLFGTSYSLVDQEELWVAQHQLASEGEEDGLEEEEEKTLQGQVGSRTGNQSLRDDLPL